MNIFINQLFPNILEAWIKEHMLFYMLNFNYKLGHNLKKSRTVIISVFTYHKTEKLIFLIIIQNIKKYKNICM